MITILNRPYRNSFENLKGICAFGFRSKEVTRQPWSKFDPGSAIDRILFELVERGFKAVYVMKKIVLRPIKFH